MVYFEKKKPYYTPKERLGRCNSMNLKDKLRLGFFIALLLIVMYFMVYYFYDGTDRRDLGEGILVELHEEIEVNYG